MPQSVLKGPPGSHILKVDDQIYRGSSAVYSQRVNHGARVPPMLMYLLLSPAIGYLQIVEGKLLFGNERRPNYIISSLATLQFLWLMASLYFAFNNPYALWLCAVPAVFICFHSSWLLFVAWLLDAEDLHSLHMVKLPAQSIRKSMSFGLFFAIFSSIACLWALRFQYA